MPTTVPLLDRSEELSRLDRAWDAARNRAVLAFVRGSAGIGKTTLLNEWLGRVHPPVHLKVDFAGNYGATTSALIEAFQIVLDEHIQDHLRWKEDLLETLGRDGSGIREVFPGFPGNTWFQPAAMLLDGEQLNRRFLQLLKSLLFVWSRCYGTILITVENWHLADAPLQGLILQLPQDQNPVLCVATSREPLLRLEAARQWHVIEIALATFSQLDIRNWIARLFPDESAPHREFLNDLCEHAAGNPLHLHEILGVESHPQASEIVRVSLGSWFDRKVQDLELPMRRFLEAGAVLGSAFRASTALECAGLQQDVRRLVAEGVQRRLLTKGEQECAWVHDLIRDAVLRSIAPGLQSAISWKAAMRIVRQDVRTTEQTLLFPGYFRAGLGSSKVPAEMRGRIVELFLASATLMRRMLNHSGARDALALLREFLTEQGAAVSDAIWMLSAEIAFERGDVVEAIELLQKPGRIFSPAVRVRRELILCRCYYVTRNFTAIFKRITRFSGVLWPARLLSTAGHAGIGLALAALIPLLTARMKRTPRARISKRRELSEHLRIALIFFTFQHYRALSAAIGLLFVVSAALHRPTYNSPMAAVIVGMFGNLPHLAKGPSLELALLAKERQSTSGNPFWNARFDFLFNLFYEPYLLGVKEMWAERQRLVEMNNRVPDQEVETILKMDLRHIYFWSDVSIEFLRQQYRIHTKIAREKGNIGLATVLELLDGLFEPTILGHSEPFRLFENPLDEKHLFQELRRRKEFFVESGFRFVQAFFALLVGNWNAASTFVLNAAEVPRDLSYWVPQVFDGYIDCIARLLSGGSKPIRVPYGILASTVARNRRELLPYLTHVDAERARKKGLRGAALRLYQRARDDFNRLERPVLAAFVDWRTGDLFWEDSDKEIARAYLERAQRGFAECGMNSSVNAIRMKYGLETRSAAVQDKSEEEYLSAALRLHRLTLLGKIAAETAAEIRNLNQSARASADGLEKDLGVLRARKDLAAAIEHTAPTLRVIQESSARIDLYLDQFHVTGNEPSTSAVMLIDLGDIIRATVEVMAPVIRRSTRKFHNGLIPRRVLIRGEALQIEEVVMNLILNACESLPGVACGVSVEWADADEHLVGFRVIDEGRGIPAGILPRVAEPFFTTKQDRGGTGLGLALCKRIVESHGGSLRIDSEPGSGTAVTVLFPKAEGRENTEKLS